PVGNVHVFALWRVGKSNANAALSICVARTVRLSENLAVDVVCAVFVFEYVRAADVLITKFAGARTTDFHPLIRLAGKRCKRLEARDLFEYTDRHAGAITAVSFVGE